MSEKMQLKAGDTAPLFSLPNEDNVVIALEDLLDYTIILYFYPKDNTSGCTTEAQEFSALQESFEKHNAIVIGISPDKPATHKKFIQSKDLNVVLLSDSDKSVAMKYHAYGKKIMYGKEVQGIYRSTFIIQKGKIIESFYNVKAKGHAQTILTYLTNLDKNK
ncbi:hypothetical protein HRAG_01475 [Helicobacter bilis ATCC 43879]|uniref:Putative peroxiredoxin bcp n=2 Tax=Helicobacteraceae TaxID=72293 RepID=C3XHC9_9HELI|nr:hypothetical protein HRAG_01475 [Helicobacter bilis ATCC 43879]